MPVAVRSYVENSSAHFVHVIASPFQDGRPAPVWTGLEVAHVEWDTRSPGRALTGARRILRSEHHDVLHAHSSFPGLYARLLRSPRTTHLVYTPHCFAFLRTDVPACVRATYRLAERMLASRTSVLAACGPGESVESQGIGIPPGRIVVVPNVSSLPAMRPPAPRATPVGGGRLRVGMLGRWAPQKDPTFFRECVDVLARELPGIEVEGWWIGASDVPTDDRERNTRVRRTGWLTPPEVGDRLRDLDVYVHSAAWEGFPIALVDAQAAGLAILCRRIAAVPDLPRALSVEGGLSALAAAVRTGRFAAWSRDNRSGWEAYLGDRSAAAQRSALTEVWTSSITVRSRR